MSHAAHHHYHVIRLTELKRIYWAHTIKQLASSMTLIFIPIYLYNLDYSLQAILWFFLLTYLLWAAGQYLLMKWSNHIGANKAMAIGLALSGVLSLLLATLSVYDWPLWLLAIVEGVSIALYWPNFRACFAKSLLHKRAGKAAGVSVALTTLAYGIAPAIGGIVAESFSIIVLYALSITLFIAAALPLLAAKEIIHHDLFRLRSLNLGKVKRDFIANMSGEIDDVILSVIWPLFIFLLIPSYVGVGILSSISVIAGIVIALYVGQRGEIKGMRRYLKRGTVVATLANIVRLFTQSAPQIAGVNFVNGLGHALWGTPYVARYYENAEEEPLLPYIYGMMMASALGDILLFSTLLIISFFFPIQTVLLVGLLLAIPAGYAVRLIR